MTAIEEDEEEDTRSEKGVRIASGNDTQEICAQESVSSSGSETLGPQKVAETEPASPVKALRSAISSCTYPNYFFKRKKAEHLWEEAMRMPTCFSSRELSVVHARAFLVRA
jgi:hypothetical protein